MTKIAVLQMTSGIDPLENAQTLVEAVQNAAQSGAKMLFTPEMSGLIDRNRARAAGNIYPQSRDPVLATLRKAAEMHDICVAIGSLAIDREDGFFANRAFIIDQKGVIRASYDKLHMFDVALASGENWRESAAYAAGDAVVTADTPAGKLGLSICYDIRFPALYQALGREKCDIIAIPAAFTVPTGIAHWHILQRARAIESTAYVVSAAQCGSHADGRKTYGHSLVVDPWGEILLDMGDEIGLGFAEIDLFRIAEIRSQLPSLANRRELPKLAEQ
jgi:deaminated glutathione amidase